MVLSEKLAALRKEHGYSQLYVAERLNVSRQAISRWEVGSSVPSTENLLELSRLYGVSLDELVGNNTEMPAQAVPDNTAIHQEPTFEHQSTKPSNSKRRTAIATGLCIALIYLLTACLWKGNRPQGENVIDIDCMQNEGIVTPDETFEFE